MSQAVVCPPAAHRPKTTCWRCAHARGHGREPASPTAARRAHHLHMANGDGTGACRIRHCPVLLTRARPCASRRGSAQARSSGAPSIAQESQSHTRTVMAGAASVSLLHEHRDARRKSRLRNFGLRQLHSAAESARARLEIARIRACMIIQCARSRDRPPSACRQAGLSSLFDRLHVELAGPSGGFVRALAPAPLACSRAALLAHHLPNLGLLLFE